MPFQSEKQRRYMHANLPEIAQRWEKDYAGGGITRVPFQLGNMAFARQQMTRPQNYYNTPFEGARTIDTYKNVDPYKMNYLNRDLPSTFRSESMLPGSTWNIQQRAQSLKPDALNIMMQGFQPGADPHGGFGEYDKWGNIRMGLENPDEDPYQSPQGLAFLKNKLGDMWGGAKDKFGEMWGGAKDIGAQTFEGIKNIGSTAGQMAMGPVSWIGKKLDRFDQLPMADQMFISQQMGGAGQMGEGIGRDPQSGAIRDLGGKNVRSMFGNYSDAVHTEFDRYDSAIEKSKDRYIKEYGSLDTKSKYGKTWAEMNKRNLQMHKYYRDKKQSQQKLAADMARKEKAKREALEAKQKIDTRPTSTYTGPQTYDYDPDKGGGRPDKPGGFLDPGKGSYGPHMAYGGRIGYAAGGIASLWQR